MVLEKHRGRLEPLGDTCFTFARARGVVPFDYSGEGPLCKRMLLSVTRDDRVVGSIISPGVGLPIGWLVGGWVDRARMWNIEIRQQALSTGWLCAMTAECRGCSWHICETWSRSNSSGIIDDVSTRRKYLGGLVWRVMSPW